MDVTLRAYRKNDRGALTKMREALHDHIASVDPRRLEVRKPGYGTAVVKHITKEISDKNGIIYVAEAGNKELIGYTAAVVESGEDDKQRWMRLGTKTGTKYGEVIDLYVDAAYRNSGVGKKLMEKAEAHLKNMGCTHIKIGVFWPNAGARKFYEGLGYELRDVTYIRKSVRRRIT